MSVSFYVGLDLGQMSDFAALAIVERTEGPEALLYVPHLYRFALGMSYPKVVEEVSQLVRRPDLKNPELVIDQTGVGLPVCDLFRQAGLPCRITRVVITAGQRCSEGDDGSLHVAKLPLVSNLQTLLQTRRLSIDPRLPEAALLRQELQSYKVTISASLNETFAAGRDSIHDDLIVAVALACWRAAKGDPWAGYTPPEARGGDYSYSDAVAKLGGYRSPKW